MKKIVVILLCLLCLLWAGSALAEKPLMARSGGLAAYYDGAGGIAIPGKSGVINANTAAGIVAVDNYRASYLTEVTEGEDFAPGDLRLVSLESFEDTLAARQVYAACELNSDSIYFVPDEARTELRRLNPATLETETVYTSNEPIDRLYASAEGMVFELAEQAGTLVYNPEAGSVDFYPGGIPKQGMLTDTHELYLTEEDILYARDLGSLVARAVDAGVSSFAPLNGGVYYIADSGTVQSLRFYDPASRKVTALSKSLPEGSGQLTASAGKLYALDTARNLYAVSPDTGAATKIGSYADLGKFSLPSGMNATGVRIEAMPGAVNVYAELEEADALPDFTFIEFESDMNAGEKSYALVNTLPIEGEASVWDALKPAPQYTTLARGSRGDAVRAIQQPLYDLGYYDYKVDGIFGPRTQWAVRLVQSDLGLRDDGIADADLQRTILSGRLSAYDPYLPLARGNRGLRVQLMQQRLRDLGYLADAADRIFGPRTQKAVQLFQRENGLAVDESATRETLRRLFSDLASPCSSYIDLYRGDTGYRVRELNNRLRELYYLESAIGSAYTAETASAVRVFQRTAGLPETGAATIPVLKELFAEDAPEAPGYIPLRRGDENDRVTALQKRLKELGYYDSRITGYYGRVTQDAVARFQQRAELKPTGVATVRTQQLLFADDAPRYVKPTFIGTPVITLDAYEYQDGRVFRIADDSAPNGVVTFTWYADGDVRTYNVRIEDDKGRIYMDSDTLLNRTGVSVATLKYKRTYTLTVTAYPEDGDSRHITSASLKFARIKPEPEKPQVAKIGNPELNVEPVARVENGIHYILPGEVELQWYAEGDVAFYRAIVLDEADHALLESGDTTDLSIAFGSDLLTQGEVYTLYVYAIPRNGTMDNARMRTLRFSLPVVELPEPEPETNTEQEETFASADAPELSFAPLAEELDGVAYLNGDILTLGWAAEGSVDHYDVTISDDAGHTLLSGSTSKPGVAFSRDKLTEGAVYTLDVTATFANGSIEETASTSALFALYEDVVDQVIDAPDAEGEETPDSDEEEVEQTDTYSQEQPPMSGGIGAPTIDFDPIEAYDGDIALVEGSTVTLSWFAEGDISTYNVEVRNSQNQQMASASTDKTSLSIHGDVLVPGETYTLIVEAVPADGAAQTATASARFAKAATAEPAPEAPAVEAVETAPETDDTPQAEEPEPEEIVAPEPEETVPQPEQPAEEPTEVERSPEEPTEVEQPVEAPEEPATEESAQDSEEETYTEESFDDYEEEAYTEEPSDDYEEETYTDESSDDYEEEAYTEESSDDYEDETYTEESFDDYEEEAYTEEPSDDYGEETDGGETAMGGEPLPDPVIGFEPVAEIMGDVTYVAGDNVTLSWSVAGDAQSYTISILDADGLPIASQSTEQSALTVPADIFEPGTVYTLSVTAVPADGSGLTSATASAKFAIRAGEAVEGDDYEEAEDF